MEPPSSLSDDYFSQGIALIIFLFSYVLVRCTESAYSAIIASDKQGRTNQIQDNESFSGAVMQAETFFTVCATVFTYYLSVNLLNGPTWSVFLRSLLVITALILFLRFVSYLLCKGKSSAGYTESSKLFSALASALLFFASPVNRLFKGIEALFSKAVLERTAQSIEDIVEVNDETDYQEVEEKRLLKGIVELPNKTVSQIMKPRVEVISLNLEMSSEEVVQREMECGFSRLPVYGAGPDDVKGFLYIKDLVKYLRENTEDFDWHKYIREAYFVPGSKRINTLLEEFRQKKIHMAIVVDEYGGTDGIVTLEDILEEILGEISDETDVAE